MHVKVCGLQKQFGPQVVLEGLEFNIPGHQFVSLVGPSGCGKSTLLRIIAGLEPCSQGEVTVESRRQFDRSFVFQDPHLLPWRTCLQNVKLPLELSGVARSEAAERAQKVLDLVGLRADLAKYPDELSGGMRMRCSLARALVSQPDLLLLDEPLAALDEPTRLRLALLIRELWQKQPTTMVMVTHSLSEALLMSDRILVLGGKPGRIEADLTVDLPPDRTSDLRASREYQRELRVLTDLFWKVSQ